VSFFSETRQQPTGFWVVTQDAGLFIPMMFIADIVIFAISALIYCGIFLASHSTAADSSMRPNVVVFLVDDMGWADIGCYGSEIPTPNIDALAKSGVRFTQFYNTARCSPTRASLMTGLYPHQAGMGHLDNEVHESTKGTQGRLRDDCVTIAEVLKDAGYFTAMTGKWHLGQQHGTTPWGRGFMRSLNSPAGGSYLPRTKKTAVWRQLNSRQ
jgi:arylsulfatase A-like enzyme